MPPYAQMWGNPPTPPSTPFLCLAQRNRVEPERNALGAVVIVTSFVFNYYRQNLKVGGSRIDWRSHSARALTLVVVRLGIPTIRCRGTGWVQLVVASE